jgi:hypothetical protein
MNGDIVYSVNLDFFKKIYLKNKKKLGRFELGWVPYGFLLGGKSLSFYQIEN